MTKKFGWSRNVLVHQIENQSYDHRRLRSLVAIELKELKGQLPAPEEIAKLLENGE